MDFGAVDNGAGGSPLNLGAHVTGNPIPQGDVSASVTVGHTWLIIVGALALLWFLGAVPFKSVRM